ncbi:MAG TPA: STAS domain-containing protein [Terriglobia bacterium]|nr:STAS domain-containing protein [Terriglobia bacterium]
MLRVTLSDDDAATTFKLEGKLTGSWVDVLEKCWRQAIEDSASKPLVVDLTAVTYVDGRGTELLERMYRTGAELRAASCMGKGIVAQIKSRNGEPAKSGR